MKPNKIEKEMLSRAARLRSDATCYRDLGRRGTAGECLRDAAAIEVDVRQRIACRIAANEEKAAKAARLAGGTATLRDRLETLTKADLVAVAKRLDIIRADGTQNFRVMSREGLARIIRQGYTRAGIASPSEQRTAIAEATASHR